jgi:hypothetical protein
LANELVEKTELGRLAKVIATTSVNAYPHNKQLETFLAARESITSSGDNKKEKLPSLHLSKKPLPAPQMNIGHVNQLLKKMPTKHIKELEIRLVDFLRKNREELVGYLIPNLK